MEFQTRGKTSSEDYLNEGEGMGFLIRLKRQHRICSLWEWDLYTDLKDKKMEGIQDTGMIFNKYYFTTSLILIWVIETEFEGTLERPGLDPWIP